MLETLLIDGSDPIRLSEVLDGGGDRLFREACKLGLEGIVSKRKDGRYRSARSNVWTKVTCRKRDTFVVAGIAFKGDKFDGIYVGRRMGRALTYAGKVENGFAAKDRQTLKALAERLRVPRQALKPPVKKPKAVWLKPKLLAEVEYRALTGDGKLRHPSFKSLREDV
jgi:bifunctional non-homologous end joining protein LigD